MNKFRNRQVVNDTINAPTPIKPPVQNVADKPKAFHFMLTSHVVTLAIVAMQIQPKYTPKADFSKVLAGVCGSNLNEITVFNCHKVYKMPSITTIESANNS